LKRGVFLRLTKVVGNYAVKLNATQGGFVKRIIGDGEFSGTGEISRPSMSKFEKYFEIKKITDEHSLKKSFSLRHKVYCEELGYEPIRESGLEYDEYDTRAVHLCVIHKRSGIFAGTVRLVFDSDQQELPFRRLLKNFKENVEDINVARLKKRRMCEVSRLAVPSEFRKRKLDDKLKLNFSSEEIECFPMISMALFYGCLTYCKHYEIGAYSMMEERLARALKISGIESFRVADFHEFNGLRAPFLFSSSFNTEKIRPEQLRILNYVYNSVIEKEKTITAA